MTFKFKVRYIFMWLYPVMSHVQDDDVSGDVSSVRTQFKEVHEEYMRKSQEYDQLFAEHSRISKVSTTYTLSVILNDVDNASVIDVQR
jgi:hypothetical protein